MALESDSQPTKVWASLITNLNYLPGLLTLHHSLARTQTAYPFVALYTSTFPESGLSALHARGIPTYAVPQITPSKLSRKYDQDPRFRETWTKLVVFSLEGVFDRIVLLDGDMLVRKNMDELMDIPLDEEDNDKDGEGKRVFAATHACACNPLKKAHYPAHWIPSNCAFTSQHSTPDTAQTTGAPLNAGVGMLNSGLLVVKPSLTAYTRIQEFLDTPEKVDSYTFPDQELLSEAFEGRWVPLPYVYNALKTMRVVGVHSVFWRDEEVKNVHYIFAVKPWQDEPPKEGPGMDVLNAWWWEANWERQRLEREGGIVDGL
ncbi:nucleotide-diphospho-sugar transferase [Aspergillus cavernicola]|uniref:Nucleotide-diphospho-sugar transferase n=1 Tax=Aspergillus cavernicola TaxID=176166 RepID=A0ABR4HKH9_9EURO